MGHPNLEKAKAEAPHHKKQKEPNTRAIGKALISAVILLVLVGTFVFVMQYTGASNQFSHNPHSPIAPQAPK